MHREGAKFRNKRQKDERIGAMEVAAWSFGIFLFTSPFVFQLTGLDPAIEFQRDMATMRRTSGSGVLIYVMRYAVALCAIISVLPQWRQYLARLRSARVPLAFAGWAILSLVWTDSFASSVNGVLALLPLLVTGTCLAFRLPLLLFARAYAYAAIWFAMFCLIYIFLFPHFGIHQQTDFAQQVHAGSWRGAYSHKNNFGGVAAAFAIIVMFAGRTVLPSTIIRLALIATLLLMVVKSNSATALLLTCVAPVVTIFIIRLRGIQQWLIGLFAVPISLLVATNIESIVALFGRDLTFTGRTSLWTIAYDSIIARPINGYGFASTTYGDFMVTIYQQFGLFDPHNGYLDLLLGTGVVGLVLFVMSLADMAKVSRNLFQQGGLHRQAGMMIFGLIATWTFSCLSESQEKPLGSFGGLGYTAFGLLLYRRRSGEGVIPKPRQRTKDRGVVQPAIGQGIRQS